MTEPADMVELLDVEPATTWDRRVVSAYEVVYAARRGVVVLRVIAVVVALLTILGSALYYFSDSDDGGFLVENSVDRQTIGQFLLSIVVPLSFAAMVLSLSYLVQISAARLDVDIVVADDDQTADSKD